MADEGVTIVLDFTSTALAETRDFLSHSARSVKGGRRTGKNEGTVASYTRRIVACPLCGGKRMDYDGPHALMNTTDVGTQRDCAGRLFLNGVLIHGGNGR